MSRHKVEDLSNQLHSVSQDRSQLDIAASNLPQQKHYENTFGEQQTQETLQGINLAEEMKNDQVEHMILDLDALKKELHETQHQFNSTRECLEIERREK